MVVILIVIGLFALLAFWSYKFHSGLVKKTIYSDECVKDGGKWRKLMKAYYAQDNNAAKEAGASDYFQCLWMAKDLEHKYWDDGTIILSWRDKEITAHIDNNYVPECLKTNSTSNETKNDFNTKGAIIGGAIGGITGAYIGGKIKKE